MKRKALLLNTSFYPNIGGVENSLRSIAEELSNEGWHVDIVTALTIETEPAEKLFGANIYRYKSSGGGTYVYNAYRLIKSLENEYELVICRHHVLAIVLKLLKFKNIKYIVPGVYKYQNIREKSLSLRSKLKYRFNMTIQGLAFRCSELFVFSDSMKLQIESIIGSNYHMTKINPGVDDKRFFQKNKEEIIALREELSLDVDKKYILGLGRFVDVKNFEVLIKAMSYTPDDFSLLLVGDGYLKEKYQSLIEEYAVSNKVIIKPSTKTPEKYYQLCDVFCLSSIYEPFGQVLLEATFSGLPIVAFDNQSCDGVDTATREIYENYPSLVNFCHSMDPESLSKQLILSTKAEFNKIEFNDFVLSKSWDGLLKKVLGEEF
ncbi:glycosyltransferase family 4 protein [Vibrio zhugei]|uniref:Glycosyltransferase family 4 protein n=1 Tax=Vibrio zhugei TaxID=2479546 RepID=A0ABV7C9V8_9VIBR|nr:glycosyltransferase family 4 protein [Vibrio zhugei]